MKSRALAAINVFLITFCAMVFVGTLDRMAHDHLAGARLPRLQEIFLWFSPIGIGVVFYPVLAAIAYFINGEKKALSPNRVLLTLIIAFVSLAIISSSITALQFATLSGGSPVYKGQVAGNIIILVTLLVMIFWPLLKRLKPIKSVQSHSGAAPLP